MTTSSLAFVDVETTALNPMDGRIWEIGIVLRDSVIGSPEDDVEMLFQIEDVFPAEFEAKAREVSGYDRRYRQAEAQMLSENYAAHVAASVLSGRHLVGANPAFDQTFLTKLLDRHGLLDRPVWHHRLIDVEALAAGANGWRVPMSLRMTSEALGVELAESEHHTALGDARQARAIYDRVINEKKE